jgi:integrase/recombinase XerD
MNYKNYLKNIKGYSEHTIKMYIKYSIELELVNLDYERLMNKYGNVSNNTRRVILSAIKKYLFFLGKDISKIELPKKDIVVMPYVKYDEYLFYLNSINKKTKMGLKKLVTLRLLFETGIRSSELLGILKTDIVKQQIKIRGKGNRERYVNISK